MPTRSGVMRDLSAISMRMATDQQKRIKIAEDLLEIRRRLEKSYEEAAEIRDVTIVSGISSVIAFIDILLTNQHQ